MSDAEKEDMLRRAFVDYRADHIVITSRRQMYQLASANYGEEQGWLSCEVDETDEQSTAYIYRLTDEGRKHFGIEGAQS